MPLAAVIGAAIGAKAIGGVAGAVIGGALGGAISNPKKPLKGALAGAVGGLTGPIAGALAPTLGAAAPIAAGALTGAVGSAIQGGDALKGALTGALSGATGPLTGALSDVLGPTVAPIASGALTGAAGAAIHGGDALKGALVGALGGATGPVTNALKSTFGEYAPYAGSALTGALQASVYDVNPIYGALQGVSSRMMQDYFNSFNEQKPAPIVEAKPVWSSSSADNSILGALINPYLNYSGQQKTFSSPTSISSNIQTPSSLFDSNDLYNFAADYSFASLAPSLSYGTSTYNLAQPWQNTYMFYEPSTTSFGGTQMWDNLFDSNDLYNFTPDYSFASFTPSLSYGSNTYSLAQSPPDENSAWWTEAYWKNKFPAVYEEFDFTPNYSLTPPAQGTVTTQTQGGVPAQPGNMARIFSPFSNIVAPQGQGSSLPSWLPWALGGLGLAGVLSDANKKTESKETVSNIMRVPDWVEQAQRISSANLLGLPIQPWQYTNPLAAGLSSNERAAIDMADQVTGAWAPQFAQAVNKATRAALSLPETNLDAYMNPYIANVLAPQLRQINQNFDNQINQLNLAAASRGAFGRTRNTLMHNLLEENRQRALSEAIDKAYADAFNYATNAALQDRSGMLSAAGMLGNMAGSYQQMLGSDIDTLLKTGAHGRNVQDILYQRQYQDYLNQLKYPLEALQTQTGGLSNIFPRVFDSFREATAVGPAPNMWSNLFGAATTTVGLLDKLGYFNRTPNNTGIMYSQYIPNQYGWVYG